MTHLDEPDVRQALHAAASHVRPSPELLTNARTGGRRRRRRARLTTVSVVAVVTVAAGGWVLMPPSTKIRSGGTAAASVPKPFQDLLDRPTVGSRAGDRQFLRQVADSWTSGTSLRKRLPKGDQLGPPHILWAGDTPAGPAAIVVQAITTDRLDSTQSSVGIVAPDRSGRPTLLGENMFEQADDGRIWADKESEKVVAMEGLRKGLAVAGVFGSGSPTLLVFGTRDVSYSRGRNYRTDGSFDLTYTPVTFDDDIAVITLPEGTNTDRVLVGRGQVSVQDITTQMAVLGQSEGGAGVMPWPQTVWRLTPGVTVRSREDEETLLSQALFTLVAFHPPTKFALSHWYAQGVSPDGRDVVVSEQAYDNDPSQIYAVLTAANGDQKVTHGGPADPSKPLPVAIRLPDRQGWVVAQNAAALRYRSGNGQWHDAGHNAALIPDLPALQVEVTRPGGTPRVVPLH